MQIGARETTPSNLKSFCLSSLALITLAFTLSSASPLPPPRVQIPPPPHRLKIIWIGVTNARAYEFQAAGDASFKADKKRFLVKNLANALPIQQLPRFARIRALEGKTILSDWFLLSTDQWSHPSLKGPIKLSLSQVEGYRLTWGPPPGAPAHVSLVYRVKIIDPKGALLFDSRLRNEQVSLPKMPKGVYEVQVEPLGDEILGSVHVEGLSTATALLEVQ